MSVQYLLHSIRCPVVLYCQQFVYSRENLKHIFSHMMHAHLSESFSKQAVECQTSRWFEGTSKRRMAVWRTLHTSTPTSIRHQLSSRLSATSIGRGGVGTNSSISLRPHQSPSPELPVPLSFGRGTRSAQRTKKSGQRPWGLSERRKSGGGNACAKNKARSSSYCHIELTAISHQRWA